MKHKEADLKTAVKSYFSVFGDADGGGPWHDEHLST
jgi:hypothetical protein